METQGAAVGMVDSNPGRMRKRRLSMLETGETAVASTGLLLAAILLLFMAAAAYFNVRGHVDAMRSARLGEIRAVRAYQPMLRREVKSR